MQKEAVMKKHLPVNGDGRNRWVAAYLATLCKANIISFTGELGVIICMSKGQ